VILVALAVERRRRDRSRSHSGSNCSLHIAVGEMEMTRVRDSTTGNNVKTGTLPVYISLRPRQSSYAMAEPTNVFLCRRRDLHIEAAPRAG
jgi:hypothetical protein